MPLPRTFRAFTLIELLVVVAIIVVIIAILLPSLARARENAKTTKCLANMNGMAKAHWMYMTDNNQFIQAGLAHGGSHASEPVAWVNTLKQYYGGQLLHRCPGDDSPHWGPKDGGAGMAVNPGPPPQFRRTSYGISDYLDPDLNTDNPYRLYTQIPSLSTTIAFLEMARTGSYAGADHIHAGLWIGINPPSNAAQMVETNAHGGPPRSWKSKANYSYLDGHAETNTFEEVFKSQQLNRFNPAVPPS